MPEVSQKHNVVTYIVVQGLEWHYLDAPKNILKAWRNFLLFNLNYFSVSLLLKTFLSHWRRYKWSYGRGFDPARYLEAFFSNLISRILGAVIRSILIILGFITEVFIFFFGLAILLCWLVVPIIAILGIYHGFRILF